jgi:hypothetical protein
MAQHEIQFKALAAREFRKLAPEIKPRIRDAVNDLAHSKLNHVLLVSRNCQGRHVCIVFG